MKLNRPNSASLMFVDNNVPTFKGVTRNLTAKFIDRLDKSENSIIKMLVDPNLVVSVSLPNLENIGLIFTGQLGQTHSLYSIVYIP